MSSPSLDDADRMIGASQSDDPLRGCSLASLISHTSLLRSSEDCPDAYEHSFPVNSVDIFLSHAWSDSGWWKQAALLSCCTPAIIYKVTAVSSIVGAWLCWYLSYKCSELVVLLITLVSFIGSIITLLLFKHRNTTVFLDKCCINQADFGAKMRGISRLSDYLRASDKLIILWSPNYLDRLWCVYELAVFMRTHDEKDVIILNVGHVKLCLYLLLIQLLGIFSFYAVRAYGGKNISVSACEMALGVATSVLLGREAFGCLQDWSTFSSKLSAFSVSNAKCTSPDDFTKLKELIKKLYGTEDHFATCVRDLCLVSTSERRAPLWLFSRDSLRISSLPYIPVIVSAIGTILAMLEDRGRARATICPIDEYCLPPSVTVELLWCVRVKVFPGVLQCFRAPYMVLLGHKLASKVRSERTNDLPLLSICYSIIFILYSLFTHDICDLQLIYDYPLAVAAIRPFTTELLFFAIGMVTVSVLFIGLKCSYSQDFSNNIMRSNC